MPEKIGIPRGLFFYDFFPFWDTFFNETGFEVVVSEPTNKRIMEQGLKYCPDEACIPVKIFFGHVLEIKDNADYIFIPRYTSVSKGEYVCPKFGGLPDMIKHLLADLPQVISTEINLRSSSKQGKKALYEIGGLLGIDEERTREAGCKALRAYYEYKKILRKGFLPLDILDCHEENKPNINIKLKQSDYTMKIAVIGHSYNIYDNFACMNLIKKLRETGADIYTIEMADEEQIENCRNKLDKKFFWYFGTRAMASAFEIIKNKDVDGIIYVMSFGCGIDSFTAYLIESRIRKETNLPFVVLTIDEHSGEAGFNTRLEAFIDMISWRRNNEDNVPAYGQHVCVCESPT